MQGSLELASKNYTTGATKIVYAIIYSLILGFSLTLGSDLAFLVLPAFRKERDAMAKDLASTVVLVGRFDPTNSSDTAYLDGTFTFSRQVDATTPITDYHYIMEGCYRDPTWPQIYQPVSWQWLLLLVPVFVLSVSCLNGQGLRGWRIWVMVTIGCCSFAGE